MLFENVCEILHFPIFLNQKVILMKKTISVLLAALLLWLFAGCSSPSETGSDPAPAVFRIRYDLGNLAGDFTDTPEIAQAGESVEIRTMVLDDADIHVYVDGEEIVKSHYDGDYWGYTFTMPERDVLVTAKPYTEEEIWGIQDVPANLSVNVLYIRTNGYHEGETYPKTFWITSREELEEYYEANREKYDLQSRENPYSDETIGFADAVKGYDASFFEQNDLIFVLLEEGSGSIRHKVVSVDITLSQKEDKLYELQPEIQRLIPECGTDDMAEWHIILEIPKEYGKTVSDLKAPVLTDERDSGSREAENGTAGTQEP